MLYPRLRYSGILRRGSAVPSCWPTWASKVGIVGSAPWAANADHSRTASITGWIVVYMTRTRRTSLVVGGLFSSLFNLGMGVGRLVLGFLTDRLGVRRAVTLYLVLALGFQALFTVVWRPPVSAAAICLLGLVLGPMYPSGITMLVSFLPRSLHVQAVASVALLGQVGGAVMPFGQGLVAETLGIQSYPYIVFSQLGTLLVVWRCFPKRSRV